MQRRSVAGTDGRMVAAAAARHARRHKLQPGKRNAWTHSSERVPPRALAGKLCAGTQRDLCIQTGDSIAYSNTHALLPAWHARRYGTDTACRAANAGACAFLYGVWRRDGPGEVHLPWRFSDARLLYPVDRGIQVRRSANGARVRFPRRQMGAIIAN
jgi:hypothetical protein